VRAEVSAAMSFLKLGLIASSCGVFVVAGCSSPPPADDGDAETVLADLESRGAPPPLPPGAFGEPSASSAGYVADVTAAGSGCPAGSWAAAVSPDGQTFTVTFSAFEVKVAPGQLFDIRQCVLNVDFRDPDGFPLSFVIGSIYHQGFGLLDSTGMRAARTTTYVFSGNGEGVLAGSPTKHADLVGPYDSSYVQADSVFSGAWSPCASVSNLVVNSNLMLQNNSQKTGSGYLNAATVDGALTLAFRLAWRKC
jgi:hypothetical protein